MAAISLLLAFHLQAGSATPGFVKATVEREPYGPMPGVPPAEPAEVLLRGLNGRILEQYTSVSLVEIGSEQQETLRQRGRENNVYVELRPEYDNIVVHTRTFDARDPSRAIPAGEIADPPYGDNVEGMWLLQFIGPIKDEWHTAVEAQGVVLVQPIPWNAYIVAATVREIERVSDLRFVQWTMQMHRFLKSAMQPPLPGYNFGGLVVLGRTEQTGATIARLSASSRVPVEVRPFGAHELQVFGLFPSGHFEDILSMPLVWALLPGHHTAVASDVPAVSGTGLFLAAAILAGVALLRLHAN